jgi:hypothetical protein
MVADFFGARPFLQDRVGFSSSRVGQHSLVLARWVQAGRSHAYPPNCDFGSVRRRARHSAALGRQGAILSPYSPPQLSWPICVAGAVVVTATTIITAPLRALTGAPPFYYVCYGPR